MKAKRIIWQSEPTAEIRSFKGFKYYANIHYGENSINFFKTYIVMSEKELNKEEIKAAVCIQFFFDFMHEPVGVYEIRDIRNVTNCKKYN